MTDLDALLAGIVAHPHEAVRWLIMADWLDDHGQPERAELLRLHRMLIDTCCEPDQHPDRAAWQARIVELIDQGVTPCVPQHTLMLPGGVPLVGNFIPPGSFLMGSEDGEDNEKPIRRMSVPSGFFVGMHPVTQLQWGAVMGFNPSLFQDDHRPVEWVGWEDATDYCTRATELLGRRVRLPTEEMWEYACRAGTTTRHHWGNVPDVRRMKADPSGMPGRIDPEQELEQTVAVGTFAPNPWGLFDCHGNVWEWCAGPYHSTSEPTAIYRPTRGGSWMELARDCRSAARDGTWPGERVEDLGFRVVFTLD